MTRLPKFSNLLHVILSPLFGARVQLKQAGSSGPGTYETFVDIMTQYKAQRINKPMVIQLVSELLRGENELIVGFNSFLAQADKIPGAGAGAQAHAQAWKRARAQARWLCARPSGSNAGVLYIVRPTGTTCALKTAPGRSRRNESPLPPPRHHK